MKNKQYFTLQLFAGIPAAVKSTTAEESSAQKLDKQKTLVKYTDRDVDKILNRKFAEWQVKKQKELDEAKRLADMNAQKKAEHEIKLLRKQLNELINERKIVELSKTAHVIFAGLFRELVQEEVAEAMWDDTAQTGEICCRFSENDCRRSLRVCLTKPCRTSFRRRKFMAGEVPRGKRS